MNSASHDSRRRFVRVSFWFGFVFVICLILYSSLTYGEGKEKLLINLVAPEFPPNSPLAKFLGGPRWEIYLEGLIDKDAAKRLLVEITARDIKQATIYINSVGGSLLTAVEIGRLIRKYGFTTYVGKMPPKNPRGSPLPGECYSACILAYIGGYYRYLIPTSQMGVHRFHSILPIDSEMDIAQIVSAAVINYLKEMGVDVGLFDRMSRAGKNDLYFLNENELNDLRVINNGMLPAKWTIEFVNSVVYLKGEQETQWGNAKAIFICAPHGTVLFEPFYYAGSNAKTIVDNAQYYSIRFDDDFVPLGNPDVPLKINNNCISALFNLGPEHLKRLTTAASVGWAAHPGNPEIFYGFTVETIGNMEKINAFIKSCRAGAGNLSLGR